MGREGEAIRMNHVMSIVAVLAWLSAGSVLAQSATPTMFTCVANGRTYSGDRPPPECANSDMRELNRDGSVRRVIPRPLGVEEQRARALEAKKRFEEEEKLQAQRRRDRSLLEAYASVEEIEDARTKALDVSIQLIKRAQSRLDRMESDKKKLDDESEFYKKRELPEHIKRAYATNAQDKVTEQKVIKEAELEMQRINERFDAEKKRFRELIAQGARPVQRNPEPDILLDPRFRSR
jgi:hypothetical protein